MRRFYLISYDITDDKRRTRVFKLLDGWGDRVQFSVFCCQLNRREKLRLAEQLKPLINQKDDQVLFLDAGAVSGEEPLPTIGYLGRIWKPEPRCQIV
ncbi:CRISPR-associated endoribonuclease Cas2 [Planctomycetales bacterium]|nr:CRISPR-associated endoribonuclease Cas2 [Planctomycetales bacterium]